MIKVKILFFFALFLLAFSWLSIIPMWHTPDEQAHFSQVAYLVEMGRNPGGGVLDTTEEIYNSEQLLGTVRDKVGNNKFTFHPEYKIEYTDSLVGKYEASISALTSTNAKNTFVHQEATRYSPAYYIPATWIYQYLYNQDIFTRVFAIRIWSLLLFILNICVVYKLGELLFPKDKLLALTIAILVGFQPMMVFSNIGVTSDSLANLLFSSFLYLCLKLILSRINIKNLILLLITSFAVINTKIQFIIILPALLLLILFLLVRDFKKQQRINLIGKFILVFFLAILYLYITRFGPLIFALESITKFNIGSFIKFTWEYTLPHTYREVLPWYWGVYDWLGVTYPRIVYRIINGITLFSFIGFTIWFISVLRRRLWRNKKIQGIFFLLGISLFYFAAISVYDWLSWYKSGFQLGVQGRYFFPLISVHMLTIVLGFKELLPNKWKLRHRGVVILGILMLVFNLYGIYAVSKIYYDVSNVQRFLWQVSQYKPFFAKAPFIITTFSLYFPSLIIFLYRYIKFPKNENH